MNGERWQLPPLRGRVRACSLSSRALGFVRQIQNLPDEFWLKQLRQRPLQSQLRSLALVINRCSPCLPVLER